MNALSRQIGGSHYLKHAIQPNEFVAANNWDAFAQNILKYVVRWRDKAGLNDLEKALHYAHLRIELRMEAYQPHIDRRPGITMNNFIKENRLAQEIEAPLLALELWVMSGGTTKFRAMFITALEMLIETARGDFEIPRDLALG